MHRSVLRESTGCAEVGRKGTGDAPCDRPRCISDINRIHERWRRATSLPLYFTFHRQVCNPAFAPGSPMISMLTMYEAL